MNRLMLEEKRPSFEQMTALYTIGYEGRELEEFTSLLKDYGVEVLVDVRDVPLSRKKGFSKSPLSQYLEEEGIDYIHLKSLGSPKDLRDKVRTDGDYGYFHAAYSSYIKSQQDSVETLHQIVINSSVCIMCYERDPYSCHRLVVAEEVNKKEGNGLAVQHI